MISSNRAIVWFRRDLRLEDHTALAAAIAQGYEVIPVFIFDKIILDKIDDKKDLRLTFIYDSLKEIEEELISYGSSLTILYGDPSVEIPNLAKELKVQKVFFNRDYEPYAIRRDNNVIHELKKLNIDVENFRDHVIFEGKDVVKNDGTPYKVFTPYSKAWLAHLQKYPQRLKKFKITKNCFHQFNNSLSILTFDWMNMIGFCYSENILVKGGRKEALARLKKFKSKISDYNQLRDFPSREGTSNISPYIRFGLISIRELIEICVQTNNPGEKSWLNELIWREFYQMILFNFPKVEKAAFKDEYNDIKWPTDQKLIEKWKNGETGVPIVDAAMRELYLYGTMPNRLRMIVASYFCKIMLQDWKIGELYFAQKLMDFDLAANNGGWQWSSSTGCDAAPYFRIFNPYAQSKKFDAEGEYIRRFCPELSHYSNKDIHAPHECDLLKQIEAKCRIGEDYPSPIVNYALKREECLKLYKTIK